MVPRNWKMILSFGFRSFGNFRLKKSESGKRKISDRESIFVFLLRNAAVSSGS